VGVAVENPGHCEKKSCTLAALHTPAPMGRQLASTPFVAGHHTHTSSAPHLPPVVAARHRLYCASVGQKGGGGVGGWHEA